jgi:Cd2+/Zn2+-exporting ATPase|tara:strand:+ start:18658 stop:20868 length:2211 start_codon:yes stop_codon:yes gene_type:complete
MKTQFEFKVLGMDCIEEVSILKRALSNYVLDEKQLGFDLLNGKLTIEPDPQNINEKQLLKAIEKTGMKAIPWTIYLMRSQKSQRFLVRHKRAILTIISALFLLFGYMAHAMTHEFLEALIGKGEVGLRFPMSSMVFYSLSIITGGWFIFPKAFTALKHVRPDMNLLMMIAVIGAIAIGQWFEAATVTFLFSLALLLEAWSVGRARQAIQMLLASAPKTACVLDVSRKITEKMLVEAIDVGSILIIRPGEKIPLDGKISRGKSHVNQAPITGESMPILKQLGDDVYAGTINEEGSLEVCVSKKSVDTMFAHIIKSIEEAQAHRSQAEQSIDVFARYYTPLMIIFAVAVMIIPPLFAYQPWLEWIYQGLVILVIACPCALVISTPVSIVAGLSCAARNGVLVKGGVYLELPAKLEAIAFDKTGTLTCGKPKIQQIIPFNKHTEDEVLVIAASLEFNSGHPLAHAISESAKEKKLTLKQVENFKSIKGKSIEGVVDGHLYWIGSHRLLQEKLNKKDSWFANEEAMKLERLGQTVIVIARENHVCGLIGIADKIRIEAENALKKLKGLGVKRIVMLTGDNEGTAKAISNEIYLDSFQSGLLPKDKIKQVQLLRKEYLTVAMVGDGVNDAPAMATASLGIAMGAIGSDVAIETADIALMSDDLMKIPWLIQHSRRTMRIIKENIIFALVTKAIFIVLAVLGVATLWMAITADMGASLIVIFNGLRLLKKKGDTENGWMKSS